MIVPLRRAVRPTWSAASSAQKLTEEFGQQFLVENHAGAGGNIGMALAARAPADGYTLLCRQPGFHGQSAALPSVPYDPTRISSRSLSRGVAEHA